MPNPSPPVPTISIAPSGAEMVTAFERNTEAPAAISDGVSPLVRSAVRKQAISTGEQSPFIISEKADFISSDCKILPSEIKFSFPYLIDETQEIAKKYNAVCTPDFFGYNKDLKLNYRGRIRELRDLKPIRNGTSELYEAMKLISETQKGPDIQKPSLGCSIKWFKK